jgi:hypothetical protein
MFKPRTILIWAFAVSLLGLAGGQTYLAAQQPGTSPGVDGAAIDLRIQLEKGLRARLPREFDFIDHVVGMVDNNQLPRDLVQSTFLWARAKKPYPFPYFESGLRLRAARRGINL